MFCWDQPFLVGWVGWLVFSCSFREKPFPVGLVGQPFQPALNQVETVEKALADVYCVLTENGWKRVLLRNVNCLNPNRLWLKRLIPVKHDSTVFFY